MEFKQLIDMPYYTKNQVMKMKKDELVESYMFLQGGYQAELDAAWQCVENANKNADAEEHNKQAGIILEENDRLQEELSNLKYDLEELQDNNEYHEAGYYKFKEEIEKLKEENKKLKETNEISHLVVGEEYKITGGKFKKYKVGTLVKINPTYSDVKVSEGAVMMATGNIGEDKMVKCKNCYLLRRNPL